MSAGGRLGRCWLLVGTPALATWVSLCGAAPLSAATFQFTVIDQAGVGFNDPTPVAPISGNNATTLGAQRFAALRAGAAAWEALLPGNRIIRVQTYHASLDCGPTFGVLGRGGAVTSLRDFPNAPLLGTWYPPALADELAGTDHDPAGFDIRIFFNIDVDHSASCLGGQRFWYGTDGLPPAGRASFRDVARHELAHGLGFNTLVDLATGRKALGRDDIYSVFLEDHSLGATWPSLSDAQRALSAIDTRDLHWVGQNVVDRAPALLGDGLHPSGHVELEAPSPLGGSNVVHWSSDLVPDELLEPAASRNPTDAITRRAFSDLGYTTRLGDTSACSGNDETLCLSAGGRFEVETWWTNGSGERSPGNAIPFTRDSGLFYFFDAGNIELLVKVLDACALNGRVWVFYAATTDVEFGLRVRDTMTGAVKSYQNRRGQAAQTITDSGAFATCGGSGGGSALDAPSDSAITQELRRLLESSSRSALAESLAPEPRDVELAGHDLAREEADLGYSKARSPSVPERARSASVASVIGLEGSRYTFAAGLSGDVNGNGTRDLDELILLHGGPDNVAAFDDQEEPLASYDFGIGTVPWLDEQVVDHGNGRLQLHLTLRTTGGAELFPAGVSVQGVPLPDVLVGLGTRGGGEPLDFLNLGVASARIQMFDGNQKRIDSQLPPASFFPGRPWNGDFAVVFSGQAGQGIDRVLLTIEVDVPIFEVSPVAPFSCVADSQTLCLANGRFEVTIGWRDFQGNTGSGEMVPISGSSDSGLSYFFDSENLEVLIKVLDARVINGRFWVFYAATTSVALEITVTDSATGRRRKYLNELGRTASAIADTGGFAP